MLRQRLLSGFVLGLAGAAVAALDIYLETRDYYMQWLGWPVRGLLCAVVIAALGIVAIREFYKLGRAAGLKPFRLVGAVVSTYLILENCGQGLSSGSLWLKLERIDFTLLIIAAGLAWAFLLQVVRWGIKGAFGNIGLTLLGAIYIGLLGSFIVRIRQMGFSDAQSYDAIRGTWYLAVFVCTIKMTDICAFFTGKYLGSHKLVPLISPGKTVEGLAGGLLGGAVTCVILCQAGGILTSVWLAVLLGVLLAGLGQLGDLAESIFKRDAQEKDSSDSVPGFGGLLDVVDSLLLPAPFAYLIFAALAMN